MKPSTLLLSLIVLFISVLALFSISAIADGPEGKPFEDEGVTAAYTLTGFKFNHLDLTYSCGNDEFKQAILEWMRVSALTDAGCTDVSPDITLTVVPNNEWEFGNAAGVGGAGHVWIKQDYEHHYGVMLHEVGHALGMGHSAESLTAPYELRSAAMFYLCCNPLNADDIAGIQKLYGPPNRTIWRRIRLPDGSSWDYEVVTSFAVPGLAQD